jgi:glutamyl/glutaminyl-tRNA synthetase
MHAYFDGNSCVNWHSGVVGTRSGCGSAFMLVFFVDNSCISISHVVCGEVG